MNKRKRELDADEEQIEPQKKMARMASSMQKMKREAVPALAVFTSSFFPLQHALVQDVIPNQCAAIYEIAVAPYSNFSTTSLSVVYVGCAADVKTRLKMFCDDKHSYLREAARQNFGIFFHYKPLNKQEQASMVYLEQHLLCKYDYAWNNYREYRNIYSSAPS